MAVPGSQSAAAWDAEVLSRVRHLHLRARVLADRLLLGQHRARRVGQAIEFADYQDYVPGMDPRRIDWRALARSDRLLVRRYETETELPCTVVLDLSGDLGTGRTGRGGLPDLLGSKAGYAITLAATLLTWLHRQGEPVGLRLIGGEGIRHADLPPRRGRVHLQLQLLTLAQARPGGKAELGAALAALGARTRRRSLVAVLTDGMEEPATWLPALQSFARRGTDLRFVHLWDRKELQLGFDGAALFYSPEGGEALAIDPKGARAEFREVVQGWLSEVRGGVIAAGGQYVAGASDEPMERLVHRIARGGSAQAVAP